MGSLVPSSPRRAWELFRVLEVAPKGTKARIRHEAKSAPSIWTSHQVPTRISHTRDEMRIAQHCWKPTDPKWPTIYSRNKLCKAVLDVPGLNITAHSRRQEDTYCKKGLSIATGLICFIEAQNLLGQEADEIESGPLVYSINATPPVWLSGLITSGLMLNAIHPIYGPVDLEQM